MSQDPLPGYGAWAPGAGYGTEMPTNQSTIQILSPSKKPSDSGAGAPPKRRLPGLQVGPGHWRPGDVSAGGSKASLYHGIIPEHGDQRPTS